jgi:polyhydroxyalkanoate synthase
MPTPYAKRAAREDIVMEDTDLAKTAQAHAETSAAFAANMAKVAERSQEIWMHFIKANAEDEHPLHADPLNTLPAFQELTQTMLENPKELAERTLDLWTKQAELWRRATLQFWGVEKEKQEPVAAPARGDKRFKHEDWSDNQVFDYIKQSYLLTSQWILGAVHEVGDLDERDRKKVDFYTRNFVEAMSPTNFAATNPEVLRATVEEKGENLVRGLDMMLADLQRGKGKLLIRQTDMDAFEVGRNMAMTPGQVVWQNDILQLIQYTPTTKEVHKTPILFIPPWINKFYILDLNPEKSFVRWLVDQGHTVFLISWINPDERQKNETWETYLFKGASAAIDKVLEETGESQVNLAGYCIGGTLTGTMTAHMSKTGDKRVKSTTFFTAQLEFSDAGELQVLVDDQTLAVVDEQMEKGYLPAQAMANAFNMLRSTDLIWGYVINNYMLGKERSTSCTGTPTAPACRRAYTTITSRRSTTRTPSPRGT